MSLIGDFLDVEPDSRGTEGREGVRYPGDARSIAFYTHKITKQAYDGMYVAQNGCCVICGRHQSEFRKRLCIDHCHKTNKIRGLLCINCNTGLGHFKDNPQILANAIEYLKGTE